MNTLDTGALRDAVRAAARAIQRHFSILRHLEEVDSRDLLGSAGSTIEAAGSFESILEQHKRKAIATLAPPVLFRRVSLYYVKNEFGDAAYVWDDVCVSLSAAHVWSNPLFSFRVRRLPRHTGCVHISCNTFHFVAEHVLHG